jgi:hypothetical protein
MIMDNLIKAVLYKRMDLKFEDVMNMTMKEITEILMQESLDKPVKLKVVEVSNEFKEPQIKPCENAFMEDGEWRINVKYVRELIDIVEERGHDLIIGKDKILIYDDYNE